MTDDELRVCSSIKFNEAKQMMMDFVNMSSDGLITLEKFAEYLHLPVSEALVALFNLYDRVSDSKFE